MGRVMPMSRRGDFNRSGRPFGRPGGRGRRGQELYLVHSGASFWGDTFNGVGRLFWAAWRFRSELTPVYWTAATMLLGAWLHAVHPNWWPLPIVAGVAVVVVVCTGRPAAVGIRFPLLRRPKVQHYTAALAVALSAWLTTATFIGATAGVMETVAVAGMLALGAPWWWWNDRRRLVRIRRVIEDFPDTAEAAKLPGARITSTDIHPWGWVARVKLRRAQRYAHVVNALEDLESAMGTRVGALRVELVADDAAQVTLRHVETDPHAAPIPFPAKPGKRPATIKEPFALGVWEDGAQARVSFLRQHALIGGTTDSGKSGLLNVILARLAECGDVIVWGVDLKEGMEFNGWRKTLHRLAVSTRTAETLLSDAVGELERRAAFLADKGLRVWDPSPDAPALVVAIDEYAELSPRARKFVDSIARRGRAVAVTLVIATQRPTQKTMGEGTAIRSQMNIRICLRVVEKPDVDLILGTGRQSAGWDTTGFDAPGKFLLIAPGHDSPRRARGYLVTDNEVSTLASHHAKPGNVTTHKPTHDDESTAGHGGKAAYIARTDGEVIKVTPNPHTGAPTGLEGHTGPVRVPGTGGTSTTSGPDMALWEALKHAPSRGASIKELMTATNRSKPVVYRKLKALRQQGKATQVDRGRWRATPPPNPPTEAT